MTKIKKNCEYCKTEFETTSARIKDGRGKFCSKGCFNNYRTGKTKPNRKGSEISCNICGKRIYVVPSRLNERRGKFCSQKCYYKSKKGKPSPKWDRVKIVCRTCGKNFFVNKARALTGQTKFCTRVCYATFMKGKQGFSKGYTFSEEQRRKCSIAQKKRFEKESVWNKDTKGVMKAWNKGISLSEKHKRNLILAHRGGKDGLIVAHNLASQRGWKLLSKEYQNNKAKLEWVCAEGHPFFMSLSKAQCGQGCAICSAGVSERLCREIFEHLLGEKFPKVRPAWLIGSQRHRLELDGYCKKLKLAFEFQGRQHYIENPFFHTKRSFENQITCDKLKRVLCAKRGITLIEIPDLQKHEQMISIIIAELMKKNVEFPEQGLMDPADFDIHNPK